MHPPSSFVLLVTLFRNHLLHIKITTYNTNIPRTEGEADKKINTSSRIHAAVRPFGLQQSEYSHKQLGFKRRGTLNVAYFSAKFNYPPQQLCLLLNRATPVFFL